MHPLRVAVVILFAVAVPPNGTGSETPGQLDFAEMQPKLTNYGVIDQSARWDRNIISTCWLNRDQFREEKTWVRQQIAATWEQYSSVQFVGWTDCTSRGADIRIAIDGSNPRSLIGSHALGVSPSMWLNFAFSDWSTGCASRRQYCIQALATHEFGHALGFAHEQLQSDAPAGCKQFLKSRGQWENVDKSLRALTPYDPDSVMNYCNSIWNNNGKLSAHDIAAVGILFPAA